MIVGSEHLRFWCDMSMECIRRDHTSELSPGDQRGPFLTARALGMALAALHDAHAVASARPPLLGIVAHASAMAPNPELAASAACAQVLRLRYPNQANLLEVAWTHWLEYFGLYPASSPAGSPPTHSVEAAGRAYGTLMHRKGAADVANSASDQYMPTGAPYNHAAPANETTQGFAGGIWGNSMPLLATRVATFPGPPGRVSPARVDPTHHFAQDFAKVVAKGEDSRAACDRSLKEEVIGIAWGYDGAAQLGTPPRLYMQVVLNILDTIEARSPAALSVSDELELLAGIAIAMADAGIDAWHYKYAGSHMMWRPAIGVPNAVAGNGSATPSWQPLGRPDTNGGGQRLTPNFPAYPSGHATFGAAAFQLLRLYLAEKGVAAFAADGIDDIRFEFVSDEFNGRNADPRTRHPREHVTLGYESLWAAIVDNSVSRVYLGVHWQFDGITTRSADGTADEYGIPSSPSALGQTGGVWLGAQIANQIALRLGVSPATITASRM